MTAALLLEVLRDARDLGLWQEQRDVLAQLGVDVAHVRFVTRRRARKPYLQTLADYEEEDEDPPTDDEIRDRNHARRVRQALEWKRCDWLAWQRRAVVTSIAGIYKRMYTDARVADRCLPPFVRTR